MELKEFNTVVGKILGIKGEVTFAEIRKDVVAREFKILLIVVPSKNQVPQFEAMLSNGNKK